MFYHNKWPFDYLILKVSCQFIVIFSIFFHHRLYSFEHLVLISKVRDAKKTLKNLRIAAAYMKEAVG